MDINTTVSMTINGEAITTDETIAVVNPATAEVFAQAPNASREHLDQAVTAARTAFYSWKKTSVAERQAMLRKAADVLEENIEQLAPIFVLEHGRPLEGVIIELQGAAHYFREFAEMTIPVEVTEDSDVRRVEVHHEPLGVVAAIAPWNFPLTLAAVKIAPALLAGNTLVLKPSPFTPLVTLKLGELLRDVFPPGVLNIISGGDELGPMMTAHNGFDKISFTGSTTTGKRVMENCVQDLKRLTLELGGNDAAIVMPDVDILEVAQKVFLGAFFNSGQICVATKRLYIHTDIYDAFRDTLVAIAQSVKVGNGLEPDTILGPIQNKRQYERVMELIDDAKTNELTLYSGAEVPSGPGYFVPVTLVDNPPADSRVVTEEAFGPVLPLIRFDNVDDVIRQVNDSDYGLAGAVWSKDIQNAVHLAHQMDTGTVWINENLYLPGSTPFGGHKQSGIGVENGLAGVLGFTFSKSIYIPK